MKPTAGTPWAQQVLNDGHESAGKMTEIQRRDSQQGKFSVYYPFILLWVESGRFDSRTENAPRIPCHYFGNQ
jgi:hypothetical protein